MNGQRESLNTRLGFILLSVGCAVGLGNIWRFPYITGVYGGGMFVLLYLLFLLLFGYPLLSIELSIGRAGRANLVGSIRNISGNRRRWVIPAKIAFAGNLLLMMFYTTITGWLVAYAVKYANNSMMQSVSPAESAAVFARLAASPGTSAAYMLVIVCVASLICGCGLQKGVESSVKVMMSLLFVLIFALAVYALTLPNAMAGVKFYLYPDVSKFADKSAKPFLPLWGRRFLPSASEWAAWRYSAVISTGNGASAAKQ